MGRRYTVLISSAVFSPCRTWRYSLTRIWNKSTGDLPLRYCAFICLNPSTADENADDPTVTRLRIRSINLGFDGLIVLNLFAFRATYPSQLKLSQSPVGPENDEHIMKGATSAGLVVCAWGNDGALYGRGRRVEDMLRKAGIRLHHLGISNTGQPKHPLYLGYNVMPGLWTK